MEFNQFLNKNYEYATEAAYKEIVRAKTKHGHKTFNSLHEGYAVLLEEVDEMWDEVKRDNKELAVAEAVQVAAMAIRFVAEFGTPPYKFPKKEVEKTGKITQISTLKQYEREIEAFKYVNPNATDFEVVNFVNALKEYKLKNNVTTSV